ncbi:cytochrome P450 [Nocardioides endophyticus]|uniref:Cytochrome P450 n=1 Tax=Nocardioides endophyticus TaxID=1353775 RepID=A0ABP8YIU0_9ACTN
MADVLDEAEPYRAPGVCPAGDRSSDDFDILDPDYLRNPYPTWDELRGTCPVAHSDRWGGSWLPTGFETVKEIARRPEDFSSRALEVTGPIPPVGKGLRVPPLSSDPPYHAAHRKLLMPLFTKSAVSSWETRIREIAVESLDRLDGRQEIDAATEYAGHVPMQVTLEMLGVRADDASALETMVDQLLRSGPRDLEQRERAARGLLDYFREVLSEPGCVEDRPDLLGHLLRLQAEDPSIDEERMLGMCFLLLVAGIDTTWAALSSSLLHLASHPADREQLVDDPRLIPAAVEEFLRAFAPVSNARVTTREVNIGGQDLPANERVILPLAAANRDPEAFDDPDQIKLDREPNNHIAFGLGIHRCLGSHLARLELRVALEEWLRRYPVFSLRADVTIEYWGGQVRGPANVPIAIGEVRR